MRTITTNSADRYVFVNLPPGTYDITVTKTGFALQTLNATVGNQVSGLALESLPTIAPESSMFLTLQSGISPDGRVAGTAVDQSSFPLDGGENTNDMDGSTSVYTPTYDGDPTGGAANQSKGVAAGATGVMPTPGFRVATGLCNQWHVDASAADAVRSAA